MVKFWRDTSSPSKFYFRPLSIGQRLAGTDKAAITAGYFDEAPPARSTIEVSGLPGGFLVEIEVIAVRPEEVL